MKTPGHLAHGICPGFVPHMMQMNMWEFYLAKTSAKNKGLHLNQRKGQFVLSSEDECAKGAKSHR